MSEYKQVDPTPNPDVIAELNGFLKPKPNQEPAMGDWQPKDYGVKVPVDWFLPWHPVHGFVTCEYLNAQAKALAAAEDWAASAVNDLKQFAAERDEARSQLSAAQARIAAAEHMVAMMKAHDAVTTLPVVDAFAKAADERDEARRQLSTAQTRIAELEEALRAAEEKFQRIQAVAMPNTMVMARAVDGEEEARAALTPTEATSPLEGDA